MIGYEARMIIKSANHKPRLQLIRSTINENQKANI